MVEQVIPDAGKLVELAAQAIYEAIDPHSGDTIATVIHNSDHLFWESAEDNDADLAKQLEAVKEICRVAAQAALDVARAQASSDTAKSEGEV